MKERLKKIMTGILALCIVLCIPVHMQKAAAAPAEGNSVKLKFHHPDLYACESRQRGVSVRRTSNEIAQKAAWGEGLFIENESEESVSNEDSSKEMIRLEDTWKIQPIIIPGDESESELEIETENESENKSESKSEFISDESSESESENFEIKSIENETAYIRPVEDEAILLDENGNEEDSVLFMGNVKILPEITDDGVFDYRTTIDGRQKPELRIRLARNGFEHIRIGEEDTGVKERYLPEEEIKDICYIVKIKNTNVVCMDAYDYQSVSEKDQSVIYKTSKNTLSLTVNGVGKTDYEIRIEGNEAYKASPVSGSITVQNSTLYDDDFYIQLSGDSKRYTFGEWMEYLNMHDGWVNKDIKITLSDEGKKYFDAVKIRKSDRNDSEKKKYIFWAENSAANASTRTVENGIRDFEAGMDKDAPHFLTFNEQSKCYEPTRTDTEQYYAEDFVLQGSLRDTGSGISRVEYTTDFTGKDAVWHMAETETSADAEEVKFTIALQDGCYDALAVRAYDYAGNVSETKKFVNDRDEFINIIVDKSEPIMNIHMSSDGQTYDGDHDTWTNKDVRVDIEVNKDSCPYAGIYKCEYIYDKIGEAVNRKNMTGMSENWIMQPMQDKLHTKLEIKEDKNGYYYFRAVSKSGIVSKEDIKKRVLVQHQAAAIKPMIVNTVDDSKRKNGWYNKASGVPLIQFEYPNYDDGVITREYDAPVTIHYKLTCGTNNVQSEEALTDTGIDDTSALHMEKTAQIGILSSDNVSEDADGVKQFVVTKEDLKKHIIDFGWDTSTKEAQDGIYTLEYWIADKAGNISEKQIRTYKIDCHEPTGLMVELAGSEFPIAKEPSIVYEKFYQNDVSGKVSAQYGISGKGTLAVLKAKKIEEWTGKTYEDFDIIDDTGAITVSPNNRCFLYIRAEDAAGNTAEGWTRGIVVDNMAPGRAGGGELMIEPAGANAHGFFNDDVAVEISIQDAPEDDNCASLMTILAAVGKDGKDTVSGKELFAFTKEFPTEDELVHASRYTTVQVVDAEENESNEAYIQITASDRSGNTKTSLQKLKIDVTKPQIDISFDKNHTVNGCFYNEVRTADIHIQELNFDASLVDISVTKDGQPYDFAISDWTNEGSEHWAAITFAEDGRYKIEVSCTDLADNTSDKVETEAFVIDRTAPVVTIQLNGRQDKPYHDNYFNTAVTAVITVVEHNFSTDNFAADIVPAAAGSTWSHDGDKHTLCLQFMDDNAYHMACSYTDMAGNPVDVNDVSNNIMQDFVIDTIAPIIFIEGIADGSANNGSIQPVISVLDFNMEAQDTVISVTTGVGDIINNTIETDSVDVETGIGYCYRLTDMTDKADNIYYLTVFARDKAGNESTITYCFSLNRKGSAYDLTQIAELMEKQYVTYDGMDDIQIVEMNVDMVENFEIYISRNGALGYSAEYSREVKGSRDTGYTYIYHIKKENFSEEGTYRLNFYSKDRAGNEVNNTTDIRGNEISFIIDNTAPKVVIDGIENGMVYDVEKQEVHISVTDNFKLSEAEIILVNKANDVIDSWDYIELASEDGQLDIMIPEYKGELSLLYRVKDAAGNEIRTVQGEQKALGNFLVTTDRLVQFLNKPSGTPFGRTILVFIMIGISAALLCIIKLFYKQTKKN